MVLFFLKIWEGSGKREEGERGGKKREGRGKWEEGGGREDNHRKRAMKFQRIVTAGTFFFKKYFVKTKLSRERRERRERMGRRGKKRKKRKRRKREVVTCSFF